MPTTTILRLLVSASLTALLAHPIEAQPAPRPGDRIRVHATGAASVEGRLVRLADDHVVLRVDGVERRAALDQTTGVERRLTRTHARTGALLGGLVGFGVGLATANEGSRDCEYWCVQIFSDGETRAIAALGGAFVGAFAGSLIGVAIRTEIWEPIGPRTARPVGSAAAGLPPSGPPAISVGVRLGM